MKLTKSILATVALAIVSVPMAAQAQTSVIGNLENVTGQNVTILRAGQLLRAQNASAILAGDIIEAGELSSAMVRLNGCNGKFTPCDQFVSSGNMVNVGSVNFCDNVASILPRVGNSTTLNALNTVGVPTSTVGTTLGNTIGTAGRAGSLFGGSGLSTLALAALGGGAIFGLTELLDDDDDEPTSS